MAGKIKLLPMLLIAALFTHHAYSQTYTLLPKKGKVTLNGSVCKNGNENNINNGAVVAVGPGAQVLIRDKKGSVVQLRPGKTYTYNAIAKMFPRKSNFSEAVAKVIFAPKVNKVNTGGVSRGGSGDSFLLEASPANAVVVVSDSIQFSVKLRNEKHTIQHNSGFLFPEDNASDTTPIRLNETSRKYATPRGSGGYSWVFHMAISDTVAGISFTLNFRVPGPAEKGLYLDELNQFRKSISRFSKEMRILLEDEYLQVNKLYLKP